MDARTGKKIRRGHIFNTTTGRTVIVAYSHGVFAGPIPGLRTREELMTTAAALRAADGLIVSPGLLTLIEDVFVGRDAPALVLHMDWQSFSRKVLPHEEGAAASMGTVEQFAAAGADALMSYLYVGHQDPEREKAEIIRNAQLARECERWGVLLMIEPRSAREKRVPEDRSDPAVMSVYARLCAEIGADLVKVIDPENDDVLSAIVQACPTPVLLAGGVRRESFEDAKARARAAVEVGCAGLVFGRNVFQAPDPRAALAALRGIVHGEG